MLRFLLLAISALGTATWIVGCSPTAPSSNSADSAPAAAEVDHEVWYACYIQGTKVGYERIVYSRVEQGGGMLRRIEGQVHLTIKRFQQTTESDIRFSTLESEDGKLIEFEGQITGGGIPMQTRGKVAGDRLEVQTTTHGKTTTTTSPWSANYGGFFAVEQSLQRQPMQPGEKRTVHGLISGTDQVAPVEMAARDFERVSLPGGNYELLRIQSTLKLPGGQPLEETLWTDRTGAVLRRSSTAMNLESYRVPKSVALERSSSNGFDLGTDLSVPVDRSLKNPHQTKRVRYRLTLEAGDPAAAFVSGASQQVRSLDPHTAEITVHAVRPGTETGKPATAEDPPGDDDRSANNWIQSDNPDIRKLAEETAAGEQDPWKVALALESAARKRITKRDYSQAFASAAEVLETGQGDCTEHAVLLAALARAQGIPARVAIGLVYLEQEGRPAFGYHMWDELYIAGRWIPMDATLALGGIGAAHLKIAHSSLKGASAFSSFLPVANLAGRLKIRIEETE